MVRIPSVEVDLSVTFGADVGTRCSSIRVGVFFLAFPEKKTQRLRVGDDLLVNNLFILIFLLRILKTDKQ